MGYSRRDRIPLRTILAAGLIFVAAVLPGCARSSAPDDPPLQAQGAPSPSLAPMPSFAPLVRKILPAVVNVSTARNAGPLLGGDEQDDAGSGEGRDPGSMPLDELLRRLLPQLLPRASLQRTTLGSGFIIDPAGYVVTSDHVVAAAEKVTVIFQDNSRHPAEIVGRDTLTDLALLKIGAGEPLPMVAWGDSATAQVGDWVLAVGNPFGLGGTVSAGIISAHERDIHSGPYDDFLQIDASINRGNSGGPAFNLAGEVIGITTAIYTPSGGSVGIGFAIPSNLARPVIDQLRAHGRVIRGWLGVQIQEMTPELAKALGLPKVDGVLVADMTGGSPAVKAGFRQGDVILTFNGQPVRKLRDLSLLVAQSPLGERAAVLIWRQGREITLSPVIEEMPETLPVAGQDQGRKKLPQAERTATILGLTLARLTPDRRQGFDVPETVDGVLVLDVAADSSAAALDIAPGDVIVTIDQQPVSTPQDAAAKLKAAAARRDGSALLLINRRGTSQFVALPTSPGTASRK